MTFLAVHTHCFSHLSFVNWRFKMVQHVGQKRIQGKHSWEGAIQLFFLSIRNYLLFFIQLYHCYRCDVVFSHYVLYFFASLQTMAVLQLWNIRPIIQVTALNHPTCTQALKQWWVQHLYITFTFQHVFTHILGIVICSPNVSFNWMF